MTLEGACHFVYKKPCPKFLDHLHKHDGADILDVQLESVLRDRNQLYPFLGSRNMSTSISISIFSAEDTS